MTTTKFKYVVLSYAFSNDAGEGFVLDWAADEIGFGQLTFVKRDGKTICETECMSPKFVKEAMTHFIENVELLDV